LSRRGQELLSRPPSAEYLREHFVRSVQASDPDTGPDGYIALCIAENRLVWDVLQPKMKASRDVPARALGYDAMIGAWPFREQLARLAPDLIEVGDPYQLAHHSLRVARERHVPAIAFCHSDLAAMADSLVGRWAGRAARRYLQELYARFDLVLAPSSVVAEHLSQIGIRHVEIQPLGVDVTTFHPNAGDARLRDRLGLRRDVRLLVFAGRLSPEKHVGDLVAAARELGERYHLLLIGGGPLPRGAPNVTMLPYQQDDLHLARLLASCDAFVHAGDQETFGLVVLEAMACALPVIAARAGALPELVDQYHTESPLIPFRDFVEKRVSPPVSRRSLTPSPPSSSSSSKPSPGPSPSPSPTLT
jgi:glycosyltransferase involved in cell wall biosynthesis